MRRHGQKVLAVKVFKKDEVLVQYMCYFDEQAHNTKKTQQQQGRS